MAFLAKPTCAQSKVSRIFEADATCDELKVLWIFEANATCVESEVLLVVNQRSCGFLEQVLIVSPSSVRRCFCFMQLLIFKPLCDSKPKGTNTHIAPSFNHSSCVTTISDFPPLSSTQRHRHKHTHIAPSFNHSNCATSISDFPPSVFITKAQAHTHMSLLNMPALLPLPATQFFSFFPSSSLAWRFFFKGPPTSHTLPIYLAWLLTFNKLPH